MKGFDIYQRFDEMLEKSLLKNKVEYIYLGNIPDGFKLNNTKIIKPKKMNDVAKILRECDGYLTASRLEPGGNHVTEALMSGLPVLYLDNGSHHEYCDGLGVPFSLNTFDKQLKNFIKNIKVLKKRALKYDYNSSKMAKTYESLFISLLKEKKRLKVIL